MTPSTSLPQPAPTPGEAVVTVRDVWKSFDDRVVLAGVSLEVPRQEIQVIMGTSGSGKSVLLRHLVGLLRPDRGQVLVFGQPVHALAGRALDALRVQIGMVFQSAALFDSLNVGENVAFPLRRHTQQSEGEIARQVSELLALVELEGTEEAMPSALSGGMRKRVGIARALALRPSLILYDEPTGGLDPITARTVDDLILRLRKELGGTAVVVTHDLDSARLLGDRFAVMEAGEFAATGRWEEIAASKNPFVHRFLTSMPR
ncbi:MAG: ABC transporter ATP-binding protein [Armatimonadota bacterium]